MEKELAVMSDHNLDMVGSQIVEFIKDPDHPVAESDLPIDQQSIVSYSKKRNPFRHPSMAGSRFGYERNKLFYPLCGEPVLTQIGRAHV